MADQTNAAPVAVSDPTPVSRAQQIEAVVAAWVDSDLRNSAISRDTDAWNQLQQAIPNLVTALKEV